MLQSLEYFQNFESFYLLLCYISTCETLYSLYFSLESQRSSIPEPMDNLDLERAAIFSPISSKSLLYLNRNATIIRVLDLCTCILLFVSSLTYRLTGLLGFSDESDKFFATISASSALNNEGLPIKLQKKKIFTV